MHSAAETLFLTYLYEEAPLQVNVNAEIIEKARMNIMKRDMNQLLFAETKAHIYSHLEESFRSFASSRLYSVMCEDLGKNDGVNHT